MSIVIGILCLLFICSSVLIVASFPISLYQKRNPLKEDAGPKEKDYYRNIFNVYGE
ncbi:hypothetical protein ACLM5H_16265 [Fredinandcohnia humi]